MLPTNSYYSATYSHGLSHCHPWVRNGQRGGGRRDPPLPPKCDGVASTKRLSGPRSSPSPTAPELAPRPRDPVPVPAADVAALLFLPPALSLVHIHPALYLLILIIVLLTPARSFASLLAPLPLPPQ